MSYGTKGLITDIDLARLLVLSISLVYAQGAGFEDCDSLFRLASLRSLRWIDHRGYIGKYGRDARTPCMVAFSTLKYSLGNG